MACKTKINVKIGRFPMLQCFIALLTCIFVSSLYGSEIIEPHFRNARWYDSIDRVKAKEKSQFVEYRKEELNVAVDPPKPWKVEHLYYKDTLLGKPVLVLYRFDLDCRQLGVGEYIFYEILEDREIYKLVDAIENKYKIELNTRYLNKKMFSNGKLNEATYVNISQYGHLHFYTKNSIISFRTNNYNYFLGWKKGTEPTCPEKSRKRELLKEKL